MVNDTVDKLKKLQAEAKVVLDESGFAGREEEQLTRFQRFLHFWVLAGKSFVRNRCPVRASALAYASLLAMVPMLAVMISISSSLLKKQGEEPIEQFIERLVDSVTPPASAELYGPQPGGAAERSRNGNDAKFIATRKEVARRINEFVGNVRSGALGVTGMVALVAVAITMLSRIENTFNDIWGVTRGRTWLARIVQYWGAITLGPLLLMVALALTSGPHFKATKDFLAELPLGLGELIGFLFRFLPFVILSLAFALFYELMPNTKVQWRAALAGGIVGGCLWQLNNLVNVLYVSRVVTNSKIYGGLGMVPVFMIGLYFSWLILLFGAQVAYAYQNRATYLKERQAEGVHQRSREFVGLRLAALVGWRFQRGEKPPALTELADRVGVPTRLAGQLLQTLVSNRVLVEVSEGEAAYVPARPLNAISAQDVLQALRAGQGMDLSTRADEARTVVRHEFERIAQAERQVAAGISLEALVDRVDKAAGGTANPGPA
jgi:membrane protein